MGKYSRLGKNTVLVFIGNIGSKLIYLLLLPFYTRWLSAADYGSTDLITVYATVLLGIVSCSIYESIFIFPKDQSAEKKSEYFSSALTFTIVVLLLCAIIFAIIDWLQQRLGWEGFFVENLWLIFGMLLASFVQQIVQQFVRAIDRILVYSITGIVHTAGIAGFSFWLIPNMGISGYVLSVMAGSLVATVYSLIFSRAYCYVHIHNVSKASTVEMLRYSVPMIPNGIMWFLLGSINRPILEHHAGLVAVGLFAVANRIAGTANTVYYIFQQAWLISAIEESRKKDYELFYNRMLKATTAIQILYAVILTWSGKFIITWFTTADYYDSYLYIPLLSMAVLFGNLAGFVGTNFATNRKSKYFFLSTVWAGIASVILNLILIPHFSIWGACWALLLSQIVNAASRIKYSWKFTRITGCSFYLKNGMFLIVSMMIWLLFPEGLGRNLIYILLLLCFILANSNIIFRMLKSSKTIMR